MASKSRMNLFIVSISLFCHAAFSVSSASSLSSTSSSPPSRSFHHESLDISSKLGTFMRVRPVFSTSSSSSPISAVPSPSSSSSSSSSTSSFTPWSEWSGCSRKCTQRRKRTCLHPESCGKNVMIERRVCPQTLSTSGGVSCAPQRRQARRRHQTFLKRLLSDIYDPAREEESTLTMEEFLYSDWSIWSRCSRSCHQRRSKECQFPLLCGRKMILEERSCFPEGTKCAEMKRNSHAYNRTKIVFRGDEELEAAIKEEEEEEKARKEANREKEGKKEEGKKEEGRKETKKRGKNETIAFGDFECGMKPTFNPRRLRIIGGTLSRRGGWPWQVSVMNRWREISCGGTLVHPQWVVTAAHCVRRKKLRPRNIIIRIGDHDNTLYERSETEVRVEAKFQHPDFDLETVDSDIALLKLERPVESSQFVQPACLPPPGQTLPPGTECFVTGWGKLHATAHSGAEILHQAKVPLIDQRACRKAFEYDITDNMLCAGYKRGHIDSCDGDSGGPLVCKMGSEKNKRSTQRRNNKRRRKTKRVNKDDNNERNNNRNKSREERRRNNHLPRGHNNNNSPDGESSGWTVFGVTSFGDGCGVKGKYGVYARVANFVDWIHKTIKDNS